MAERKIYYGGQAVIEGVMIRGPRSMAVACRNPEGEVVIRAQSLGGIYSGPIRKIPLIRGMIVMWETLALGLRALAFSSNVAMGQEEQEGQSNAMWGMAIVTLVIVSVIFFAGPLLLADWLEGLIGSHTLVIHRGRHHTAGRDRRRM